MARMDSREEQVGKPNAIFIAFDDAYFYLAKSCVHSIQLNYPHHPELLINYPGQTVSVHDFISKIPNARLINHSHSLDFNLGIVQKDIIYNRFILWTDAFDDYDKVLHLDVDTLVLAPLDEIFQHEDFIIVSDNHQKAHIFLKDDELCPLSRQVERDQELDHKLNEDGVTQESKTIPMGNAGVFLLPARYRNRIHYHQLIEIGSRYNQHIAYADQSIIALWCFFNNIPITHQYQFNCQIRFISGEESPVAPSEIKILHFAGESKNLDRCKLLSGTAKRVHEVCHELRHYFRLARSEVGHQAVILDQLNYLVKVKKPDSSSCILLKNQHPYLGFDKIIEGKCLREFDLLEKNFSGVLFVFIEQVEDLLDIHFEQLKGSVEPVLLIDETYFTASQESLGEELFLEKISQFSLILCSDYQCKLWLGSCVRVPCIHLPTVIDTKANSLEAINPVIDSKKLLLVVDSSDSVDLTIFSSLSDHVEVFYADQIRRDSNKTLEFLSSITGQTYLIDLSRKFHPWILLAAAKAAIVFGFSSNDYLRECYPYTLVEVDDLQSLFRKIKNLFESPEEERFISELARVRAERFNPCATSVALKQKLKHQVPKYNSSFREFDDGQYPSVDHLIRRLSGPETVSVSNTDFVVCCVLKDAAAYIPSWYEHYSRLGAKHFFVVDNMSNDNSRGLLNGLSNLTLFETDLEFRLYENDIRKTIVKKYCNSTWALSVDIDEFFDFPSSNVLNMQQFLEYQNGQGFTCVLSYMQDMIAMSDSGEESFIVANRYIDNRHTFKANYSNLGTIYNKYNQFEGERQFCYGGVRSLCFNGDVSQTLLLKHALTFQDGNLEPHTDPHFCDKARISDVGSVLLHYKFMPEFIPMIFSRAESPVFNYFSTKHYQQYAEYLKANSIQADEAGVLYSGVDSLVNSGLVKVSNKFRYYVKQIEFSVEKSMYRPLISCLCVTSNRAHQLKKSIECFNAQSYSNKEMVVICDRKDIDTLQLLKQFQSDAIRVFPQENMNEMPLGTLRNMAISNASGDYVCTWDDDDWFNIDRLELQYAALDRHKKWGCVLSKIFILDSVNQASYLAYPRLWENSLMINKAFLIENDIFYPPSRIGEDYQLVDKLVAANALYPLEDPALYVYRISGSNTWPMEHFNHVTKKCIPLTHYQHIILSKAFDDASTPIEVSKKIYSQYFMASIWYVEPTKEPRP